MVNTRKRHELDAIVRRAVEPSALVFTDELGAAMGDAQVRVGLSWAQVMKRRLGLHLEL